MSEQPWIGPNGQVMRRLELHLTYTCPERCVFCSEEHRMEQFRAFPVTFGRVATVLRQHARRGVTNVHFTGESRPFTLDLWMYYDWQKTGYAHLHWYDRYTTRGPRSQNELCHF